MWFLAVPSLVSLLIQAIGALLFASLCLLLQKATHRAPLVYWSIGWFALFGALSALFLAFIFPSVGRVGQGAYVFGEYVFAYMLNVGCRRYITGRGPAKSELWLIIPGVFLGVYLPALGGGDFNAFFAVHTLLFAYLIFGAFRVLWRVWPDRGSVLGVRVVKIALLLLTVDYLHYVPLFAVSAYGLAPPAIPYLAYSPLYDLIFLVLLAFGMVMVTTGEVQHDIERVNAELEQARDRLAAMAQLDHLTSALNRHAFYSIVGDSHLGTRVVFSGCAAVADIDNLKMLNDRYGHTVGDAAIRAAAGAIRACIRADDLLFRWGGDEFLVLLIGMTESDARARLDRANEMLRRTPLVGVPAPVNVSVSVGYASFDSASSLDQVIAVADTAMYGRKRTATTA